MNPAPSTRIAVLGGGIAGLAAAFWLRRAMPQAEISLFESASRCGGVIGSLNRGGLLLETGPLAFPVAAPATAGLLSGCGIADQLSRGAECAPAGLWQGSRILTLTRTARGVLRAGLLSWRCLARLLCEPFIPKSRAQDESVRDFFQRRTGREFLEAVMEPLCSGISAGDPADLSMAANYPAFREWERHWGRMARGLWRQERSRGPSTLPESASGREGNGKIIEAVVSHLRADGVRFRLGLEVEDIGATESAGLAIRTADGITERFDGAISCLRAPDLARAYPSAGTEVRAFLDNVPCASVVLAYLAFRKRDLENGFPGAHCLVQGRSRIGILSLSLPSRMQPHRCPQDMELVRVSLGGARDAGAAGLEEASLRERATHAAGRILSTSAIPAEFICVRQPASLPQLTVGHVQRLELARERLRRDLPALILSGTSVCGAGIERAVSEARRAANELAGRLSSGSPG